MSGPSSADLRPFEPVSDALILVALDRAERHQKPNRWHETGVNWTRLVEHLGFVHHSGTTRKLRPQVEALIEAGLVTRTKNSSRVRWGLTETGALRVAQARIDGEAVLPVSPQRQKWQRARSEAGEQIESVRERLRSELREALKLLDGGKADSGDWYDVAERLKLRMQPPRRSSVCMSGASPTTSTPTWSTNHRPAGRSVVACPDSFGKMRREVSSDER